MDNSSTSSSLQVTNPLDVPCVPWSTALKVLQEGPENLYFLNDGPRMGMPMVAVYTREDWGALPTTDTKPIRKPVTNVRFIDTGKDSKLCKDPEDCFPILRDLQRDHISRDHLPDLNYNFLIGMDGSVYEARGWTSDVVRPKEFQHLDGNCVDVAFIGEWDADKGPTPRMLISGYNWIIHGNEKGFIAKKPNIVHILDTAELGKTFNRYQENKI